MLLKKSIAFVELAISMLCMPGKAEARWRVAESEHFVVYADDSERDLQRFGEMLERYHAGLELATGRQMATPSPSNRLTVFAVGGQRDIAELQGADSRSLAGFYIPRASGSLAFVQDVRPSNSRIHFSMTVLLHEYAHHFFSVTSGYALPGWMSEGGAEFFASARFPSDGDLEIGRPALHRRGELLYAAQVPIRQLLSYNTRIDRLGSDAFYGRSWLLYHYLRMEREDQLERYRRSVNSGNSPLDAGEEVFDDLDALEDELNSYMRCRRIDLFTIDASYLTVSPVTVRDVSDGMSDVMDVMIQSKRGVTREQATELVPEIRAVAAAHPGDAGVLAALAKAEYDAGNDALAIAAADRAIPLDPSIANAYVQKGYALFRIAGESGLDADYSAAMAPFQALNRIENDHPLPLIYYYRSYAERGREPPEQARHALERALELAPFDMSLRFQTVQMLAQEGKVALARQVIQPLIANPHDAGMVRVARMFDDTLSEAEEGTPVSMSFRETVEVVALPEPRAGGDDGEKTKPAD